MKALPIGIENFKEMIDHQYYYAVSYKHLRAHETSQDLG